MNRHGSFLAVVATCILVCNVSQATTYHVTDLGTLGGQTWATAINETGQVVGSSYLADGTTCHAFLYSDGTMTDLGTFGGTNSWAYDINNSGQVVGAADLTGDTACHAFRYDDSVKVDLGTLGGDVSAAISINDFGQIAGESGTTGNSAQHAFRYSGSTMEDLGILPGPGGWRSLGRGINDSGHVVGFASTDSGWRAFLFDGSIMTDLGTLPGDHDSAALRINNSEEVIGRSYPAVSGEHGFLYSDSVMTDLGTLGGDNTSPCGINDGGQIVGESTLSGSAVSHAFIYQDSIMTDLNTLLDSSGTGWLLQSAHDINNLGQIVGHGFHGSQNHAFLLTPVPEPSAVALFATGMTFLIGYIGRQRNTHLNK